MTGTIFMATGILSGLVFGTQPATGAVGRNASPDTLAIVAELQVTSRFTPTDFVVALDPDPADPDAKLEILKFTQDGRYRVDLARDLGDRAEVYVVTPATYRVTRPKYGQSASVLASGGDVDFRIRRQNPQSGARALTFWKHQVNIRLKGGGQGEVPRDALEEEYPKLIQTEFGGGALGAPGGGSLSLSSMHDIFSVAREDDDLARARQQYLTLLLNSVSGKIDPDLQIADDGTTVRDAIRYVASLLGDDSRENDDDAASIAAKINEGRREKDGEIPQGCLSPVAAQIDRGREIRVFRHDGEELQGRFSGLALDKGLLTMTVATDEGDQSLDLRAEEILKIQYRDAKSVSAPAVIGGFLIGAVAGLFIGVSAVDKDAGAGQYFYVPPEPIVGAGVGAILGIVGGAVLSSMDKTRTIECENGQAKKREQW